MNQDDFKDKLLKYAEFQIEEKQRKSGAIIKKENPIYAIYVRKSTESDEKQVDSIDSQFERCIRYARQANLKIFRDEPFKEEKSAFESDKRVVFDSLLKEISQKNRRFNSILAFTPDRLSRNMKEAGILIDMLDKGQIVDMKFAAFHFENDYNGLMNLGIHFVMAKQYSDNLSVHTHKGIQKKVESGKGLATPKLGYRFQSKENRYFRPDGKNYQLVKDAFQMALEGKTQAEIAKYLNTMKFKFRDKLRIMSENPVSRMLKDPFYAGVFVFGNEIANMQNADPLFEPIITPREFFLIREILEGKTRTFSPFQSTTILLQDLVTCSFCGSIMKPSDKNKGKTKKYLRVGCNKVNCERNTRDDNGKRKYRKDLRGYIIFDVIEEILKDGIKVDEKLFDRYKHGAVRQIILEREEVSKHSVNIKRQITELNNEIKGLEESLFNADDKTLMKRINEKINDLEQAKDQLLNRQIKIDEQLLLLESHIENETKISYEKFAELFEYANGVIQNSNNMYIVQNLIKTIFSNFSVDHEKVVAVGINPIFEGYLKLGSISNGVASGTRTHDNSLHRRALYQLSYGHHN